MTQTFLAATVATVFFATTACPAYAQTSAGTALPNVTGTPVQSSNESMGAPASNRRAAVRIDPIAASAEAVVWAAETGRREAGESTSAASTDSGHRGLALTAAILGSIAFGVGLAAHSVASSNCKTTNGVCDSVNTFGNVLMPIGAISAGVGFFFLFHHSD